MQPNACSIKKIKDDMTGTSQPGADGPNYLPPEVMEIVWPALQVGGLSGLSGVTFGAFAGIATSNHPRLFATAAGIQWFTLGTTFWASREFVLQTWGKDKVTPRDKIYASAIAGTLAGTAGGLLRRRSNVLPGMFMFTLLGATGQYMYNAADARKSALAEQPEIAKKSWLDSKWSPMTVLSDQEYEKILQEKLLSVNAQIALVDESIEALKAQEREETSPSGGAKPDPTKKL